MTEFNNFNVNLDSDFPPEQNSATVGENREQEEFSQNGTSETVLVPKINPEIVKEKATIKEDARFIGLAFLVMSGLVYLMNFFVVVISLIIKRGAGVEAANFLWEPAVMQVQQILFASISFTIPFILIFKIIGIRISNLISFAKPEKSTVLPFFLIGIAFCSFSNIATSIADSIFSSSNINYEVTKPENPQGFFGFLLSLLSSVAIPALIEEFTCRGILLGHLKKHGEGFAIVVSALLFGLMHGNFEQIPFAFLVGLVLGFITLKSGTIWIAVAVHGFNNLISVLFQYVFSAFSQNAQNIGYNIYLLFSMVLGIFALFLFYKKGKDLYKLEEPVTVSGGKQKFIWFFTSVPILIYISICLIDSLQYFVF